MRVISRQEDKINIKKKDHRRHCSGDRKGKLSIVGIGPGALNYLTKKATDAIVKADVIVGYSTYLKLLGNLIKGKEIILSGMTKEIERANKAIEKTALGKRVCVISSGDAGIYGMAGLVLELLNPDFAIAKSAPAKFKRISRTLSLKLPEAISRGRRADRLNPIGFNLDRRGNPKQIFNAKFGIKNNDVKKFTIEIIPGITAASSCASLLGAPLAQDFVVISLSDLMVSPREIELKLKMAIKAGFVVVLYNPQSKQRTKLLERAWRIIKQYRPPNTPVGIVKNAYRIGQNVIMTTLDKTALIKDIDMLTTIIIGNSKTFIKNNYMITRRGYDIK